MEITTVEPFLEYFDKIRGRTLRVARVIPAASLDWSYREGKWTFGDLLRHLGAIERYMFAENARGRPSLYPGHGPELAGTLDEVFEFLERMHRESLEIFATLAPEDLVRRCRTPGGAELPVWKWLRAMVEHEIHHRGQLYLYLSMLDVKTPPLYGLTEEEVFSRSERSDRARPAP